MMTKKIIPLLIASTSILSGCNAEKQTVRDAHETTAVSKENAIAIVNGKYISKAALAQLVEEINQRFPKHDHSREKLIEELIQQELLIQEALNKQLDKSAEYADRLEIAKNSLLSQAAIQNYIKSNPVTDADLKAEYRKNIVASAMEYKARHILLKTEEEAKHIIEELAKGADFIELAKTKSTGPSKSKGGDLGWFSATQMVSPFSEAAIALKDGEFSTEPVQSQFGWHVILKEGSRELTPLSFESVKEKIRLALQHQKVQDFMTNIRNQATIEIISPKKPEVASPVAEKIEVDSRHKSTTSN